MKNRDFAEELTLENDNRIDWERKKKKREADATADYELDEETRFPHLVNGSGKKNRRVSRKKRRELIYDEESGEVVVRRKRKRQRNDDWHEAY